MSKFKFLYKFIFNKKSIKYLRFSSLFPFLGTILGIIIVSLTLSIMNGMEYSIFTKLKNLSFPSEIKNFSSENDIDSLIIILNKNDYKGSLGVSDKIILNNNINNKLVNIKGFSDLSSFEENIFNKRTDLLNNEDNYIYIGLDLSESLNLELGDSVFILTTDLNIFTGLPYRKLFIIGGIYKSEILDYDQKYIFTHYDFLKDFLSVSKRVLYTDKVLDSDIKKQINSSFPLYQIKNWNEDHMSFISAMKIEKIIYSLIGILIIGISAFTLLSTMGLSVMRKISQIGILRSMGVAENKIMFIFLFQAFITWFISCLFSFLILLAIFFFNKKYDFIKLLFNSSFIIDFPLILNINDILSILIFSFLILNFAAFYPSFKASRLSIISSLGYKK